MRSRWLGRSVLVDGNWATAFEIGGHPFLIRPAEKGAKYLYWGFDHIDVVDPTTKRITYLRVKNVSGKTVQTSPLGGVAKACAPYWGSRQKISR